MKRLVAAVLIVLLVCGLWMWMSAHSQAPAPIPAPASSATVVPQTPVSPVAESERPLTGQSANPSAIKPASPATSVTPTASTSSELSPGTSVELVLSRQAWKLETPFESRQLTLTIVNNGSAPIQIDRRLLRPWVMGKLEDPNGEAGAGGDPAVRRAQESKDAASPLSDRAERLIDMLGCWRAGGELRVLAAKDTSGNVGRVVLRRAFVHRWGVVETMDLAAALASTKSISGKDVVDAYAQTGSQTRPKLDAPNVGEPLLSVLGSMGHRAGDAAPFLVAEMERNQGSLLYVAKIRFVLAIIGHEPEVNFAEMVKTLRTEARNRSNLMAFMSTLPLAEVLPEPFKGDIVSALRDYLSSEIGSEQGKPFAAEALAQAGVHDANVVDTIRTLMRKTGTPTKSISESTYIPVCDYISYGYALARMDASHQKEEVRGMLDKAGSYRLAWPIDTCMAAIGHEAPPAIIGHVFEVLSTGDRPAVLASLAVLSGAGGRAPAGAQDKILEILKRSDDVATRYWAVQALAGVADPSIAATLLDLAKREQSENLKEAMLDTAESLRLFE